MSAPAVNRRPKSCRLKTFTKSRAERPLTIS